MAIICTLCGGTNVSCECIANPNNGTIYDYREGAFYEAYCDDCEENVVIVDIERERSNTKILYNDFIKVNNEKPDMVRCEIVLKETGEVKNETIKLDPSVNTHDLSAIYTCNGIEELIKLFDWSKERSFSLIGVHLFHKYGS